MENHHLSQVTLVLVEAVAEPVEISADRMVVQVAVREVIRQGVFPELD